MERQETYFSVLSEGELIEIVRQSTLNSVKNLIQSLRPYQVSNAILDIVNKKFYLDIVSPNYINIVEELSNSNAVAKYVNSASQIDRETASRERRDPTRVIDDPDKELVGRWHAGDEAAFEQLIRRHERKVFRLLLRMMGNREEAEDVAQETFLSLHRHGHRFGLR